MTMLQNNDCLYKDEIEDTTTVSNKIPCRASESETKMAKIKGRSICTSVNHQTKAKVNVFRRKIVKHEMSERCFEVSALSQFEEIDNQKKLETMMAKTEGSIT